MSKIGKRKSFILGFASACLCFVVIYNVKVGVGVLKGEMPVERKIGVIEKLIDENFVEDVDQDELKEYIYAGYVAGLDDKYSTYMTAEQFKLFKESLNGSYSGIGIKVGFNEKSQMEVSEVYANSPAEKAGILSGDIIYSVGDIQIKDSDSYKAAIDFIKNSEKAFVIKGKHFGGAEFEAEVSAENIDVPSVCSKMLEGDIGYIRITEFEANTADSFKAALEGLSGMKGLVIDLRDNPGGFLTTVNEIADVILPEGNITYIEYKNGDKKYYKSDKDCFDLPIAVLVNSNSASASEVLTGAIKDYGVGTIVGTTTYGKGVVQDSFALSDGSCVKLTVAKYYTPNGECIHGKGIEPDVEVFAPESFKLAPVTDDKAVVDLANDVQLKKALEVLGE